MPSPASPSPVSIKQLKTTAPQGLSAWHARKLSDSLCVSLPSAGWKKGQGPLPWLRCAKCQQCLSIFVFADVGFLCRTSMESGSHTWFQMCDWEHQCFVYHRQGVRRPLHVCECVCLCVCVCVCLTAVAWALCQSSTELWSCSQLCPLTSQFEAQPTTD